MFRPFVYDLFIAGEKRDDILSSMAAIKRQQMGVKPFLSPMLEDNPGRMI
jgi:hypothetical protein